MANTIPLIVFPVKDLEKAKAFYNTYLGTEPYVDGEWYVGYKLDSMEIGLDPNGVAVVSYIDTDDIKTSLKTLQNAGATVTMEPKDVGGGLLVAQVEIEGNIMGLRQAAA
ncbi:MAG TPA: glyoxalase [Candidatus Saccharimonadia bacterium]|nr:glyoxalase [Candidatus Saccharimonadia bacterium]